MAKQIPQQEKAGAGATLAEQKGKIIEFAWWMKKQGYSEITIRERTRCLRRLAGKANIFDPESVKEAIANQSWKESTKRYAVVLYSCFLNMLGLTWDPPIYKPRESLPFIPTEEEIDQLIASCGRKLSVFLQGSKETGADPGELIAIRWIDVDSKNRTVTINHPVKGHNPRMLPISGKLLDMLQRLPKCSDRVFGNTTPRGMYNNFFPQRKKAAIKLANPRLKKITFVTIRHWKGTTEYHKTKDILHVKRVLGHKRIDSTMIYINLENALFKTVNEEFTARVAHDIKEACELIETGFEFVTGEYSDGGKIFRRRK